MFTHTYEPRYGDYKNYDTLKTSSLLDMVQDVAIRDSARCGYDMPTLSSMHLAWFLQGINLCYVKPVTPRTSLEVSTAIQSLGGATSARGCLIYQGGELVAKTIANWFLFDTQREKITRISPEMQSAYSFRDFNDDFFKFKKPVLSNEWESLYSIRVSNKEIDTNLHLNNQKSAELLMDALPFDYAFNNMKIMYKKSAYLGDVLEVCRAKTEHGYSIHLQTVKKEICVAGTFEIL